MKAIDVLLSSLLDIGVDVISFSFLVRQFGVKIEGHSIAHFEALGAEDLGKCGEILQNMRTLTKKKGADIDWAWVDQAAQAITCLRLWRSVDGQDEIVNAMLAKALESLPTTPGVARR